MRLITIDNKTKKDLLKEFEEYLNTNRFSKNSITFSSSLKATAKTEDKPTVVFTPIAYLKMLQLISSTDTEIGWHGTVTRNDNTFTITDILVYPQVVTGATVQTDDVEYGNWLHQSITDEEINTLRFHGHSHVNFGVSPSSTDTQFYDQILQSLQPEDYYIFLIKNKKGDTFIEIYDLAKNCIWETKDITIDILADGMFLSDWADDQQDLVKEQKYSQTKWEFPETYDARLGIITDYSKNYKKLSNYFKGGLYD